MAIIMTLAGHKRVERRFNRLADNVQKKIARPAVKKALIPVRDDAKSKVEVESGVLKNSISISKIKTYRSSGAVTGVVGPRSDKTREFQGKTRRPIKYAHLVEFGTSHSAAKPFLRPALFNNQGKINKEFAAEVERGIIKELRLG